MGVKSVTWNGREKIVTYDDGGMKRHDLTKQDHGSTWDGHKHKGSKDWQNFSQRDKENSRK